MKSFFSNVWTKRVVSVLALFYPIAIGYLSYYSIFYNIQVEDKLSLCLITSAVSVIALVLMLYSREQILTRVSSFVMLLMMLPVVLLFFEEKELYIPIVLTGVVILLFSGAGEGTKTVVGTLILLLYIFGALGFYLYNAFFVTHAKTQIVDEGLSKTGRYRYQIVNTEDTSGGSTAVYLEPNYADLEYPLAKFTLKNMSHIVYLERPMLEEIKIDWQVQDRQAITDYLNHISNSIDVTLSDEEFDELGLPIDSRLQVANINVYTLFEVGKTAADVEPLKLDTLTDEQLAVFDIGRDNAGMYYVLQPTAELYTYLEKTTGERIYLNELDAKGRNVFNNSHLDELGYTYYDLQKDNTIPLNKLSDAQLAELGIEDSGDVMIFNGKVIFRYYVADIEDYFDVDSRKLSIDLLNK